jgi:hypothetical protein
MLSGQVGFFVFISPISRKDVLTEAEFGTKQPRIVLGPLIQEAISGNQLSTSDGGRSRGGSISMNLWSESLALSFHPR